jgi:uncharacterized protein (DUF4415 family)
MKDGLSQPGARRRTKGASTGRSSKPRKASGTDWERLRRKSNREIREGIAADPDAQATDEKFWKDAKVVWPVPKQMVTMRLDADLLRWFRRQPGYQTRINAILRAYMSAQVSSR